MSILKTVTKRFAKRFIVYPVIIGVVMLYFFEFIMATELGMHFIESGPLAIFSDALGINIPFETFKYYYIYAVGFSYGTLASVLPLHRMKLGIIGFILMYLQLGVSVLIFAPIAMFWIPLELGIIALILLFAKRTLFPKRQKVKKDKNYNPYQTFQSGQVSEVNEKKTNY